jgi:TctA family transporter
MKWGAFFLEFLRNLVLTLVIAGAVLGTLGYLWGGVEGLRNALSWALAITLFSAPLSALMLIQGKYWADFAGRYSTWYVKKETEGEKPSASRAEDGEDRWPRKHS